ncbi:uncharacterized protein clcf1 isoform X2 [Fundulus heteroclitus]|uniref:uncharacterized protein clcf1 isoform X2 n=1 Tax=Fundulus heteroclitus TaxID=8078 RepID=UPI00165B57B1|nr:uncharacterized protein clcf1 isoform X2 [Fundulus heteroclitus]
MRVFCGDGQLLTVLLAASLAAAVDPSHNLASERSSIESTYELTKYLEYQLKEIKDVYLTYLGPPFNEKDFSPPRPNSTALTLPSAATRLELWHGLENQARLAQNQRAYSILLAAVRELARSTLCPSLKTSLLHFCTGLDGLLGSISALMNSLGYSSPLQAAAGELQYSQRGSGGNRPAPLMSQSLYRSRAGSRTEPGQRGGQRRSRIKMIGGERDDSDPMSRRRGRTGKRAEAAVAAGRSGGLREKGRGERVRREERDDQIETVEEVQELRGEVESWGRRRRLLSIEENEDEKDGEPKIRVEVSYVGARETVRHQETNSNQYSFSLNPDHRETLREDGLILETNRRSVSKEEKNADMDSASSSSLHRYHRRPRSLLYPTLQPPLSTLSLLYQFGVSEEHTLLPQPMPLSLQRGTSLLSPPLSPLLSSSTSSSTSSSLLPARPTMNDFARKVEGFWILRELQSWLWRSAKDFNRLKKRLRG